MISLAMCDYLIMKNKYIHIRECDYYFLPTRLVYGEKVISFRCQIMGGKHMTPGIGWESLAISIPSNPNPGPLDLCVLSLLHHYANLAAPLASQLFLLIDRSYISFFLLLHPTATPLSPRSMETLVTAALVALLATMTLPNPKKLLSWPTMTMMCCRGSTWTSTSSTRQQCAINMHAHDVDVTI